MWPFNKKEATVIEPRFKPGDKVYIDKNEDSHEVVEATIVKKSEASNYCAQWIVKKKNGKKYTVYSSSIHGKVELDKTT